jgi:hypothetical protein
MRETERKEEEIKQYEEALKKREKKCSIREEQWKKRKKMCYVISHAVGSTLCVVMSISMCRIPINMCYNFKLFYISYLKFLYNYFLKFIVHKINSKLIKYEIVKLTERKKD